MKFEVTLDLLYEMAMCIVDNNLNRDDACEYVKSCVMEDVTEVKCVYCKEEIFHCICVNKQ